MFDKDDIQHSLKTGADSDLVFTREVTDKKSADFNKLKTKDGIFKYPMLSRSTGNSIKGSTETIESNELRKGRTKSAPRLGSSSAEGSLDIELSPTTFDDLLEAAFRSKWRRWKSDTDSPVNIDGSKFSDGFFMTRCIDKYTQNQTIYNPKQNFEGRRLLNLGGATTEGLLDVPKGCIVHELTCGTEDIKYSVLKKFGGKTDEDLYQEFKHMAINTFSLDVQIGAIVTGSFGFMGNNNPELMDEYETRAFFGGAGTSRFEKNQKTGTGFIDDLPLKSTDTDQFTSREGNLWINGKNITFAESLSMELNNGLEKKYAIFVKNAISTQPLSLDITGDLSTYLVFGESDELYNLGVSDSTNEILFCFQDKEKNPDFTYLVQIFKSKIGDQDLSSSGPDTFTQSHPYSSFEERAVRIFRIALPIPTEIMFEPAEQWTSAGAILIRPNVALAETADITGALSVKVILKDEAGDPLEIAPLELTEANAEITPEGLIKVTETKIVGGELATIRDVTVTLNGKTLQKSFGMKGKDVPAAPTDLAVNPGSTSTTLAATWTPTPATSYSVIDVLKEDKSVWTRKFDSKVAECTVEKLEPATKYSVKVYSINKDGIMSLPSDPITATTNA